MTQLDIIVDNDRRVGIVGDGYIQSIIKLRCLKPFQEESQYPLILETNGIAIHLAVHALIGARYVRQALCQEKFC